MFKLRRYLPSTTAALLLITLAAVSVSGASAQAATGAIDQQCSAIGSNYLDGVGIHQPAGQTFIPTQSSLTGLAVFLRSDNPTPTSMTANIVSNGMAGVNNGQGAIVGTVTFTVPAGYGQPTGAWLNVPLPSGIVLTLGAVYALNIVDNSSSSGIKWSACSTPYANGCGFANGQCQAYSWAFVEYYGDFTVAFSTTGVSIAQGTAGSVNLYVASQQNFASPVTLTFSAPPGVTASFNGPNEIETSAGGTSSPTVTIYVAGTVASGTYPFTVTATSGGLKHSATLQLIVTPTAGTPPLLAPVSVPDFAISSILQPAPAAVALSPGASQSATIILTSGGFASTVSLSAAWSGSSPSGVTICLPSPVTVPASGSASSTLTITVDNSPSTGSYSLVVTASNGAIVHTTTIPVVIAGAPVVLAPVTPTVAVSGGVSHSTDITLLLNSPGPFIIGSNFGNQ